MEVKTKFKVGDSVYRKGGRKANLTRVDAIVIDIDGVKYRHYDPLGNRTYEAEEKNCFATKEECNLAIIEEIAGETRKE